MFTHRSSVVFPDPLGPMTTTVSPRATLSDTPRNTSFVPKRFTMPDISSAGRAMGSPGGNPGDNSVGNEDSAFKVFSIQGQCIADAEIHPRRREENLERRQRAFDHLAAGDRPVPP